MLRQRPDNFRFNEFSPLATGRMFAGLGFRGSDKTTHYHDSSLYGNHGTLTNMDPATDWVWDSTLNRWRVDCDGINDYIDLIGTNTKFGTSLIPYGATFCTWLYVPVLVNGVVVSKGKFLDHGFQLRLTSSAEVRAYCNYATTDASNLSAASKFAAATWFHLAMTIDASKNVRTFVNGIYAGAASPTQGSGDYVDYDGPVRWGVQASDAGTALAASFADTMIYSDVLPDTQLAQLADPSNVMLSGLILPPRRRLWAVSGGAPAAFKPAWARGKNTLIGGGVA